MPIFAWINAPKRLLKFQRKRCFLHAWFNFDGCLLSGSAIDVSTCSNITLRHIQRNVGMLLSWLLTKSSFLQIVNQSVEKVRNGTSKDANWLQKRTSMLKKSAQSGPAHCLPFDVSIMHSCSNAITNLICSSITHPFRAIYRASREFCARSRWV